MKKQKRILLIYTNYSTFVERDFEILSEKYLVDKYQFKLSKKVIPFVFQFIKQFIFLLFKTYKYNLFFIWFVDYHAFFPTLFAKIFGKKSLAIIGGFDAVSIPEISFGIFYKNNLRTKLARLTYRRLNAILPVDKSLIESTNYYVNPKGQKIGFLNFVDGINGFVKAVPTGYNPDIWQSISCNKNRDIVTVGGCSDITTFKRKGHDFFIELATSLPQYSFTLVGISDNLREEIKDSIPENLKVFGFLKQEEIIKQFSSHKVFTQFSMSEGLPNTLCEAMLCNNIPVGSSANGIPYAIANCGYVLENKNLQKAGELLTKAVEGLETLDNPRERIIKLFNRDIRKAELIQIIDFELDKKNSDLLNPSFI